jgi:nucleotide-binding universal stress UspA family protein
MTPTRVLLAVDTRSTSAAAIRWTARRSERACTLIDIVSVATDDDLLLADARTAVAAARTEILRSAPAARVTASVRRGNVVDVLVESSESTDLLVVGSDRPRPLRAFLHTGLAMRLTGRVRCPLVVVPSTWSGIPGTTVAVGWDDGRAAELAVEAAAHEAEASGLPLRIHHVWRPVAVSSYDAVGGAALVSAMAEGERLALARVVRETAERHPALTISGELHLGGGGDAIRGHASRAELLVVGSHRRSAVGEILAGATGDDLIAAGSGIPVMVTAPDVGRSPRADDHQDDHDDHQDRDEA